jgi:hypothetical protein
LSLPIYHCAVRYLGDFLLHDRWFDPTASSTQYNGPITVATSMTIKAIAIDPSLQNSSVATAAYTIQVGGAPVINFGDGFASVAGVDAERGKCERCYQPGGGESRYCDG